MNEAMKGISMSLEREGWLREVLFFFQAEDGIRDIGVTGVQTCALPIYLLNCGSERPGSPELRGELRLIAWAAVGCPDPAPAPGPNTGSAGDHHRLIGFARQERKGVGEGKSGGLGGCRIN